MKTIRRKASEIAPVVLRCYNGAGPDRIKYRVNYYLRGDSKLHVSEFDSKCDQVELANWLERNGHIAHKQTVISGTK